MAILAFTALGIVILSYRLTKKITHPSVLFAGLWLLIMALYLTPVFSIVQVDERVEFIIGAMLISFSVGSLLCGSALKRYFHRKNANTGRKSLSQGVRLHEVLFFALCITASIVMLIDQFEIIKQLLSGVSYADLVSGENGQQTVEYSGTLQMFLYVFLVWPVTYFVSPVCAAEFFAKQTGQMKYLIMNLIVVILTVVHHGGRAAIIIFIISYALSYFAFRDRGRISSKQKHVMIGLLIIAIVVIFALSASRGISKFGLSFYCYFVAGIPISQYYLDSLVILVPETCGCFSFYGFAFPLFSLFKALGFLSPEFNAATSLNEMIDATFVNIGLGYGSNEYNAFMPAGVYPYIDGGYLFEVVVMAGYGILCTYFFIKTQREKNVANIAIYCFLGYGLILSFTRFYFASIGYAMAFIYLLFFLYFIPRYYGKQSEKV